jgi:hypothetical protein
MGSWSERPPQLSVMDCINDHLYLDREMAATSAAALSAAKIATMRF